ncbi:hypothetical protein IL45_04735 [Nonlabens ulvanivorans]|uniref:Uncharacterized protein n=1 Tax=Nonlabens ulvanivorans TaxID=906888 RepID=A0A084JX38_NONUL|nr:hypothetical protein [Nonlabens ulvanivorans]KEZ93522.1 hypothetical protein IL45_04735 [Nonlabens ulvanivorans]
MRELKIELSEEQYKLLNQEIANGTQINFEEETHSGFTVELNSIEGGISWIDFKMQNELEIGEVTWSLT